MTHRINKCSPDSEGNELLTYLGQIAEIDFYKRNNKIREVVRGFIERVSDREEMNRQLLNALESDDDSFRCEAAHYLEKDHSEQVTQGLIQLLNHEDLEVRHRASMAIARHPGSEVTRALIDFINAKRPEEVLCYVVKGLANRENTAEVKDLLADILLGKFEANMEDEFDSYGSYRRRDAAEALATYPKDETKKEVFMKALADTTWFVVEKAIFALEEFIDDSEVYQAILEKMSDKAYKVVEAAVMVLKDVHTPEVTEAMVAAFRSRVVKGSPDARRTLMLYLGDRKGDPLVREALEEWLKVVEGYAKEQDDWGWKYEKKELESVLRRLEVV